VRAALCLALVGITPFAFAQIDVTPPPADQNAPASPQFPVPSQQKKPTEPGGFSNPAPKQGNLPAPNPATENDRVLHILQSGSTQRIGNFLKLAGGAKVEYRGYDITADEIVGDLSTEIFEASGHVHVQGVDAEVTGARVKVSYHDKTYVAYDSESQLQPPLFQGGLLAPLYVKAPESFGSQREIFAFDSDSTTCDLPDPHFYIKSKSADIRPNTRAIFRKLTLNVLGRNLLSLPYLSLPLNQPTYRYIPEFGRNPQDGYFVKTRYGIPLDNPANNLDARFDYFQKRGNAIGGDYSYAGKALSGLLSVYALAGAGHMLNLNSQHQQQFKWGTVGLDASYQQDNEGFAPDSKILSTRLQAAFPQGRSSSRFSFYRTTNSSGDFTSKSQTVSIGDTRIYSPTLRSNLDVSMVSNEGGTVKNQQVTVNLTGDDDLKQAIAHFQYQRAIPVGTVENFFNSSDQTPVVSLASDSSRLLGKHALPNLPFTTALSLGEYVDAASNDHITRSAFDFGFQRTDTSQRRSHLMMDGRFRQGMYSDDTAQYTLTYNATASYALGRDTGLNLRYNYLRPYGFSPLVMDQTGKTNLISGDLSVRPFRPFLIGVQGGYDLEALRQGTQTPYQFVGVRTEYTPAQWFSLRALSNYDPIQQIWNNVRVDLAYRPGSTFVSIGSQYDGQRKVWGSTSIFVNGFTAGRLKTSALIQYNGYTKKFETQHFSFVYDLHCAEAVLEVLDNQTGFNPGRQVMFFLRLKALPFQSPFGVGSFGQALGTGGGIRF